MRFVSIASLLLTVPLAGCVIVTNDGNDGKTGPTSLAIHGVKAGGDFKMSGRLALDAGKLKVTVAAIRDPDAPTKPADPAKVAFAISAASKAMSCTVGQVSASSKASVDLAFINDTTGSMSGTVNGIADSVQKFAEEVAAGGVDARFSMVTYGDAFATRSDTTKFTIGKADFDAPDFDGDARPYVDLTLLEQFKGFLTELRGSDVLGVGGGDGEENTLGALAWSNKKLAWRDGAARMFIAIGDNPSHQKGSSTSIDASPFAPPTGAQVVTDLDGSAVVHVIGNDVGSAPFYNLKTLADQTGGAFIDLPSDGVVDLGALDLKSWLTRSFAGTCTDPTGGTYSIELKATIAGTKSYVGTLTFDVTLS